MQNNVNTNLERIIAKIDNDFNPDNSDWIPRVGAWCIDAMSQLDALRTKRKRVKISVKDRIAYSACAIDNVDIKVYDKEGCEIREAKGGIDGCGFPSTGKVASGTSDSDIAITSSTVSAVNTSKLNAPSMVAETVNDKYPYRYNMREQVIAGAGDVDKNFVIVDCNKLELSFDTDFIYIETEYIETNYSEVYGCNLPVIPNNGLLIEAIAYYCMYKMLCRGYKHPVFSLAASQYGTNPYYIWNTLKEEARRSVINNGFDNEKSASELFRSSLFIDTFNPRK